MSDSFHPVPSCIGLTNSVQPYWKFAIMIMPTSAVPSWNQRLLTFIARPPRGADAPAVHGVHRAASRRRTPLAWRALRSQAGQIGRASCRERLELADRDVT